MRYSSAKTKLSYFISLFFFLFLFLNQISLAQVTQQWFKAYNYSHNTLSLGYKIKTDKQNNVYLLGTSTNAPGLEPLICLIKLNANGVIQWIARYNNGFNGYNYPWDMAIDLSGNVYIVGTSQRDSLGNSRDILLLKYSPSGNILMEKRYSGNTNFYLADGVSVILNDGKIYLAGTIFEENDGTGVNYCVTLAYDNAGKLLWMDKYAGNDGRTDCLGYFIQLDSNKNIYTGGYIHYDSLSNNVGFYVQKISSSGNVIWRKSRFFQWVSYPNAMEVSSTGFVYMGGGINHSSTSSSDMGILKFDNSGNLCWTKIFENSVEGSYDYILDIKVDNKENVYFTGRDIVPGNYLDIATGKVDSSSQIVWFNHFDPEMGNDDTGFSLVLDDSNNVYVAGKSGFGQGSDIVTLRINTDGDFKWSKIFSSESSYSSDEGHSICLDTQNSILVGGFSYTTPNTSDMLAIKYSQTTNINFTTTSINDFSLAQNSPNPFNPVTQIHYQIPKASFVTIKVYDVLGKEIMTLVNQNQASGTYETIFDGANFSSGIYFYRIQAGDFAETKKMMLIK